MQSIKSESLLLDESQWSLKSKKNMKGAAAGENHKSINDYKELFQFSHGQLQKSNGSTSFVKLLGNMRRCVQNSWNEKTFVFGELPFFVRNILVQNIIAERSSSVLEYKTLSLPLDKMFNVLSSFSRSSTDINPKFLYLICNWKLIAFLKTNITFNVLLP